MTLSSTTAKILTDSASLASRSTDLHLETVDMEGESRGLGPNFPFRIGPYYLHSVIGTGGMGRVFKGVHTEPTGARRAVAVKFGGCKDAHKVAMSREAHILSQLNLPSVPRLFDTGQYQGRPYLVMEFITGVTLKQLIRSEKPVPVATCIRLMRSLCHSLNLLRVSEGAGVSAPIVHADLKPSNLMVTSEDSLKVLDFGIAQFAGRSSPTGSSCGTPSYMAPEQIQKKPLDTRTDLFSVGVILYELLCGERMFPEKDPAVLLANRVNLDRSLDRMHIRTKIAKRCPGLIKPILRCVRQKPCDRYEGVDALLLRLDALQRTYPHRASERAAWRT